MTPVTRTPPDRRAARLRRLHAVTSLVEGELRAPAPPAPDTSEPYQPFANVEARNDLQALVEVPLMLHALGVPRGGRVLEVGCGRGIALPVLAGRLRPARLVGLDIDAALLREADRRVRGLTGVEIREGDLRALPIADASMDLVIDFGTCYHVAGGEHGARRALEEIARVLRPGGLFVHETRVAQHLAHPVRSFGHSLPWDAVPALRPHRWAGLWAMRVRRT